MSKSHTSILEFNGWRKAIHNIECKSITGSVIPANTLLWECPAITVIPKPNKEPFVSETKTIYLSEEEYTLEKLKISSDNLWKLNFHSSRKVK